MHRSVVVSVTGCPWARQPPRLDRSGGRTWTGGRGGGDQSISRLAFQPQHSNPPIGRRRGQAEKGCGNWGSGTGCCRRSRLEPDTVVTVLRLRSVRVVLAIRLRANDRRRPDHTVARNRGRGEPRRKAPDRRRRHGLDKLGRAQVLPAIDAIARREASVRSGVEAGDQERDCDLGSNRRQQTLRPPAPLVDRPPRAVRHCPQVNRSTTTQAVRTPIIPGGASPIGFGSA